ncbi:MAG: ABC transporter ATP-binding protein [Acidobacteriia bacterium]|nr:ABC transporter ATP-binding protein [Terriglobia bacterium]
MGDPPILEARRLTKRFGALTALDGLDFDLARGESLAVFGPNGAGKTTLTRILTSSLRMTSGSILIDGRDPRAHEIETKRILGLISHQTFLYDDLSARENLIFFARLYGLDAPGERADALLDSVRLLDRADDPARTFSRGMQQRLALARCLIHDPRIVFLDEPFTGLDPYAAALLRATLERLRHEGRTLFLVTHNLAEGLELSDRFMILAGGRIRAQGVSRGLDRLAFERSYFEHVGGPPPGGARA